MTTYQQTAGLSRLVWMTRRGADRQAQVGWSSTDLEACNQDHLSWAALSHLPIVAPTMGLTALYLNDLLK